jgi:hypothetical protein
MGDGCASKHLKAIPEEAQNGVGEMRANTEAADVTEEDAGPSLPPSPEFAALELDEAGE